MQIDFKPFFIKYNEIVVTVDSAFSAVQKRHDDCVKCKVSCADCCHALFDLTLIEAIFINQQFNRIYSGVEKERLLEKANRYDRKVVKIKRQAQKDKENGKTETEILGKLAHQRLRCPLLDEKDRCELYEFRPITCRLYGIPTSIAGMGHCCGLSGFREGMPYPTVNMDSIHRRLYDISAELVESVQSKYVRLAEMLVPLSMALLTEYDTSYLGIRSNGDIQERQKGDPHE